MCIVTPERLVGVACPQIEENRRPLGDRDFHYDSAVGAAQGFGERDDCVDHRAEIIPYID